jgi:hypothetical protein
MNVVLLPVSSKKSKGHWLPIVKGTKRYSLGDAIVLFSFRIDICAIALSSTLSVVNT